MNPSTSGKIIILFVVWYAWGGATQVLTFLRNYSKLERWPEIAPLALWSHLALAAASFMCVYGLLKFKRWGALLAIGLPLCQGLLALGFLWAFDRDFSRHQLRFLAYIFYIGAPLLFFTRKDIRRSFEA